MTRFFIEYFSRTMGTLPSAHLVVLLPATARILKKNRAERCPEWHESQLGSSWDIGDCSLHPKHVTHFPTGRTQVQE